jgi:hypothetical protein
VISEAISNPDIASLVDWKTAAERFDEKIGISKVFNHSASQNAMKS